VTSTSLRVHISKHFIKVTYVGLLQARDIHDRVIYTERSHLDR
jgi:hypothetical protein